jgi:hypothetical protein
MINLVLFGSLTLFFGLLTFYVVKLQIRVKRIEDDNKHVALALNQLLKLVEASLNKTAKLMTTNLDPNNYSSEEDFMEAVMKEMEEQQDSEIEAMENMYSSDKKKILQ